MTAPQQSNPGDLVAPRAQDHGSVENLHDVAVVLRAPVLRAPDLHLPDGPPSPAADLSNVIPFARARRVPAEPSAPSVMVTAEDRPAVPPSDVNIYHRLALAACSILIHGALLYAVWQQPKELASIGVEAITVEIVVGDNRPAGIAPTPGQNEVLPSPPAEEVKADDTLPEQEQQHVAEVRADAPIEAPAERAREQPADVTQTEVGEQSPEQQPDTRPALAMVETPNAETPAVPPRETPPDQQAVIVPAREQPKEVRPLEPRAKQPSPKQPSLKQLVQKKVEQRKAEPKQTEPRAEPRRMEPKRDVSRPTRASPNVPADAASGSGRRAVTNDPNYRGIVNAHLARYKQYPASARSGGIQGSGAVTFSISGGGSVTSVSVSRGTGAGVLDQELAAMVRRASPFPPPPGGRAMSFTVPVSWRLN